MEIGIVQSPFKDRFAVPRQPGLVPEAKGVIKFHGDPDLKTALRTLEEFSHIWVVFVFHVHGGHNWKPSVRPPRLGGACKVGVLSSRSPHRPNPIGISAVKLDRIEIDADGGPEVFISGLDLLDGTPVLDIKPYIPYADAIPEANAGWASTPIVKIPVHFEHQADAEITGYGHDVKFSSLRSLTAELLGLDPRSAAQKRKFPPQASASMGLCYGFDVLGLDVRYQIRQDGFWVTSVTKIVSS